MNTLYRTKCYTIGAMEYANGINWRELVESTLGPRNIIVFNPYKKPFLNDCDESPDVRQRMRQYMTQGRFSAVTEWARDIRRYDLNLVDRSDFIIAKRTLISQTKDLFILSFPKCTFHVFATFQFQFVAQIAAAGFSNLRSFFLFRLPILLLFVHNLISSFQIHC